MSKKKKNKQKISKAQILQATRQTTDRVEVTTASAHTTGPMPSNVTPAFNSAAVYGGQFEHVKTDMNYFIIIAIIYGILLIVGYYLNNQYHFVLEAGNRLYEFLGI